MRQKERKRLQRVPQPRFNLALFSIEGVNDEAVTAGPRHRQQAGQDAGDLHEPRERVACQAFHQDDVQHYIVFVFIFKSFLFTGSNLQSRA